MGRQTGTFNFSANFEVGYQGPLDARISVGYLSDLTGNTIPYAYSGMVVSVVNEASATNNGIYYYKGSNQSSLNSWVKLLDTSYNFIDSYVTGGTYSNGSATFTNNTGGTFTIGGFTTPFTGGTVTGATVFTNSVSANTITGGTLSVTSLSGTTTRMLEINSSGNIAANSTIISAYLTSGGTVANLLENTSNWDVDGNYTGTTITGTYQGQKHYNNNYFFEAVADNLFIRLIRG